MTLNPATYFQLPLHLPHKIQLSELMMSPLYHSQASCPVVVVVSSLVDQFFWSHYKRRIASWNCSTILTLSSGLSNNQFSCARVMHQVWWHNPSFTKSFIIVNLRNYNKQIIYILVRPLSFYSPIFLLPCKMQLLQQLSY